MSCRDCIASPSDPPFALKEKVCSKNILLLNTVYQEVSREVWKLQNNFGLSIFRPSDHCILRLFALRLWWDHKSQFHYETAPKCMSLGIWWFIINFIWREYPDSPFGGRTSSGLRTAWRLNLLEALLKHQEGHDTSLMQGRLPCNFLCAHWIGHPGVLLSKFL